MKVTKHFGGGITKMNGGGKLESKDKRSKKSDTALNRLRLKRAQKNYKKKTEKYGSVSEAAETGSRAVKKVTRAEDRLKRRAAIAGRDPEATVQKTSSSKKHKTAKPPRRRPTKAPKAKGKPGSQKGAMFAEAPRRGDRLKSFLSKCAGNTCAQKQRRSGGSAAFK